jgi:hypothetical protein
VSELGRLTDVIAVQSLKALAGIVVVPTGIVTSPLPSGVIVQAHADLLPGPEKEAVDGMFTQVKAFVPLNAELETVAVLVIENTADVKDAQLPNAEAPIVVTAARIAIASRPELANALTPIDVSELGRLTDFKAAQPSKELAEILVVPAGIVTSPFPTGVIKQKHIGLRPV